jgi:hypothetical protein
MRFSPRAELPRAAPGASAPRIVVSLYHAQMAAQRRYRAIIHVRDGIDEIQRLVIARTHR